MIVNKSFFVFNNNIFRLRYIYIVGNGIQIDIINNYNDIIFFVSCLLSVFCVPCFICLLIF